MIPGGTPILILKEGTKRESGKSAQINNIAAAKAIADAVRTTLGPRGMDKMLVDSLGDVVITNDGVTILKEIDVEHPAAKMIIEIAKTQDEQCGDGTTTAVILAGELLKRAETLIEQNVHPTIITEGYRLASEKAIEILKKVALEVKPEDEETLKNLAKTSMTGKSASVVKDKLAEIAVKAVKMVAEERDGKIKVDKDNIKIEKKQGGSISDTELIEGIVLDKERVHENMPSYVKEAKIALLNAALEIKKTEVDAKINITSPEQLQAFLNEEEKMLKDMVEKIKASGAKVVLCQKGIDDMAQHFLAKAGIYAVRRVKKSVEKLAKATGGTIVSNLDDLTDEDLGKAELVEERKIGGDKMTFVTGCRGAKAVTILVRGGSEHVIDEIERSVVDAISVVAVALEDSKMTAGGGATAIELAKELKKYAVEVGGREEMAVVAFAEALEVIPKTLAENAGLDPINTLIELRKAHSEGKKHHGLNVYTGEIEDMVKLHVIEPLRVGVQAIQSATETTNMILRIDDIIAAKQTEPPKGGGGGGMGGEMGGMEY